jgi:hypothetical protein
MYIIESIPTTNFEMDESFGFSFFRSSAKYFHRQSQQKYLSQHNIMSLDHSSLISLENYKFRAEKALSVVALATGKINNNSMSR